MAENNFENIEKSFGYITEVLESIRAQNAMNAGSTDKVLVSINSYLEDLANEENSDLIKVFLAEIKRSLDERHSFVSSKFNEIQMAFANLVQKSEDQIQKHEVKEVFEIISSNLNVFAHDFASQKDLISQIGSKIEELKNDDSQKRDIVRNISVLKTELEKFSNGFESIVLNFNDQFKGLTEVLSRIDATEPLEGLKKDIENVFLSSNAILSTLQVVDRKNRDLEGVITHLVTKEDFILEREQVAKLILQNIQITDYMNTLPTQNQLATLTERVDTSVGVINALKNMLSESGKQNQQMLTAQLDNLEAKILNISTEDEFIGFRKELSEFAHEVIESANLMRADLADTNSGIKSLYEFLNSMDIKNSFMNFTKISKTSEDNVKGSISNLASALSEENLKNKAFAKESEDSIKASISNLSTTISEEIEKNKNLTKEDIDDGILNVNNNTNASIDLAKKEITENSKVNFSNIVEHIQSVINNIFSIKNALHIENMENVEALDSKLQDLKEDISTSSNFIVQNSQGNLENIIKNIEKVFKEIVAVKGGLGENTVAQNAHMKESFDYVTQTIGEIRSDLNEVSQENYGKILSIVEGFSQEISDVKTTLEEASHGEAKDLRETIGGLSLKINTLRENLTKGSDVNFFEVKNSIGDLTQIIQSASASLEQNSSVGFAGLKSNIEEISQELKEVQDNFDVKNEANLVKILSLFEELSKEFNASKEFLKESTQTNFETLSLYIQNFSQKLDETKTDLDDNLTSNFSQIQNSISSLPQMIKENQIIFENENKTLIEENSKNIEEMGEKIQNLVKGIVAKDNPFKGEVLYEFAALKTNFEQIKEDLNQSNQGLSENVTQQIDQLIENIETTINQHNEKYNTTLLGLQNMIVEYFEHIRHTTYESDLKIDNSLKETSEIKSEIYSVKGSLALLREDSKLTTLSNDMGERFDGILVDIAQLEDKISKENGDSIQTILSDLEEKFGAVSEEIKGYKNHASSTIKELIEDLSEKTDSLKSQISLTGTDVVSVLSAKSDGIITWLLQINESVTKFAEVNFEDVANDIKNQIDSSYFSIKATIKEDMKKEHDEQAQKLLQNFDNLNNKLDDIRSNISSDNTHEFEELKSILSEKFENTALVNEALRGVLDKLKEVTAASNLNVAATQEIVSEAKKEIITEFSAFEDTLTQTQSEIKNSILAGMVQAQGETKTAILDGLTELQKESEEKILEELKDNITAVKEDTQSSAQITQDVVSEVIERTNEASAQKVLEKIDSLEDRMLESQDDLKANVLEEMREAQDDAKTAIIEDITQIQDKLKAEVLYGINKAQDNVKTEIMGGIIQSQDNLRTVILDEIKENTAVIQKDYHLSTQSLVSDAIGQTTEESREKVFEKIDTLEGKIFESQDDLKKKVLEEIKESTQFIRENYNLSTRALVSDVIEQKAEESREQVFEKLEVIENKIIEAQNGTKTAVLEEIIQAQDETKTILLEEIKESIASIKANYNLPTQSLSSDSIENTVEASGEKVLEKLDAIEDKIYESHNRLKTNILEEIKESVDFARESHNLSTRSLVSEAVERTIETSGEKVFEKLEAMEKKIFEAQDNLKTVVLEEIKEDIASIKENYNLSTQSSDSESIESTVGESRERVFAKLDAIEDRLLDAQDITKTAVLTELKETVAFIQENFNTSTKDLTSENVEQSIEESRDKVIEKLGEIEDRLIDTQDGTKTAVLQELKENVAVIQKNFSNSTKDLVSEVIEQTTEESIEKVFAKLDAIEDRLLDAQEISKTAVLQELKENVAVIQENYHHSTKDLDSGTIEQSIEESREKVIEKLGEIDDRLIDAQDDTKSAVSEVIEQTTEKSREKVFEKLGEIEAKILEAQDEAKSATLEEILQGQDEVKTTILIELKENINSIKENLAAANADGEFNEKLSHKIETLQEDLQSISENIESKLLAAETNYKHSAQSLLSEVKTSFYEKVDDSFDELRSFIEISEEKKDISLDLDNLKTEVFDKIDDISYNLENSISSVNFKDELEDLNKNIEVSIDNLLTKIEEKLHASSENNLSVEDIPDRTEEITRRIEEFKSAISEDISEKLAGFELSREGQQQDFSSSIEEIKTSFADFKDNYAELSLNSMMEVSGTLMTIQEQVESIQNKIDELNLDEKFNNLQAELSNFDFSESFETSKDEIIKEFVTINQKLDLLSFESDSEIADGINEIKQIINSQGTFIKKLDKLEELESLLKTDGSTNFKTEIQETLKKFEEKLGTYTPGAGGETSTGNVKADWDSLKEELLSGLVGFFNQISFTTEAEDIKDFVEEKTEEIKAEILSKLNNIDIPVSSGDLTLRGELEENFDNILSSLDLLREKTNNVDNNCFDIQNEIKEVKSHLQAVKSSLKDETEYSYTLQDVESDIAKIRLILKENAQAQPTGEVSFGGDLGKLNEDIMSLSSRTNKILLNSDESYATLKNNLDELRNVVYQFEEKVRYIDNKEPIRRLEKKLETVNNLVLSSVKSDKIFNQSFMYLAEWIDKADDKMNDLKQSMLKPSDMEKLLDKFSKKFDRQEEKIKSLEAKIEKLTKMPPAKTTAAKSADLKTLVREVLSQVEKPEFKVDTKLSKKVDGIDRQLATLGQSIAKITSYVDEE